MPARRRAQEAKRRERRLLAEIFAAQPPSPEEQVERAWREHLDHGWCCPDCDPQHPAGLLNDALDEIAAYKADLPTHD